MKFFRGVVPLGATALFLGATGCFNLGKVPGARQALSIAPYQKARSVISKHCISCHSDWDKYSERNFVTSGLIVPGKPRSSKIPMRVLGGTGIGGQPANMPAFSSQFTGDDYQALYDWVLSASSRAGGPFDCNNGYVRPSSLKRLSRAQLENSFRSLAEDPDKGGLSPSEVTEIWGGQYSGITPYLSLVPRDVSRYSPNATDQNISSEHVLNWYQLANAFGSIVLSNGRQERFIRAFAGKELNGSPNACALGAPGMLNYQSTACVDKFINRFGLFAFKRPLTPTEKQDFSVAFVSSPLFSELIGMFLTSPQFLFHLESAASSPGAVTSLTPFEIAAKLSYSYWQTLPDQELLNAAMNGTLGTPSGFDAQASRVFADSRSKASYGEFVSDWLGLKDKFAEGTFKAYDPGTIYIGGFSSSDQARIDAWRLAVVQEAKDFFYYHGFKTRNRYPALLTSDTTFARNSDLVRITETPAWNGVWETPAHAPASQGRAGLLSLSAWVIHGNNLYPRAIMRGVRTLERFACEKFVFPPVNNPPQNAPLELTTDSQFTRVVKATQNQGSSCINCHANRINPIGKAFEYFGSFGQPRTQEIRFDEQNNSSFNTAISASTSATVGSTTSQLESLPDLSNAIIASSLGETCLVQMFSEFTNQTAFDVEQDACTSNDYYDRLTNQTDGSIYRMFEGRALQSEFRLRSTSP